MVFSALRVAVSSSIEIVILALASSAYFDTK